MSLLTKETLRWNLTNLGMDHWQEIKYNYSTNTQYTISPVVYVTKSSLKVYPLILWTGVGETSGL